MTTCQGCDSKVHVSEPYVVSATEAISGAPATSWHIKCFLESDREDESPFEMPAMDPRPQG